MDIKEAIEIYRTRDEESGYEDRSYPACIGLVDGVVAIADENDNGSSLQMYRAADFIAWIQEAIDHYACCVDGEYDEFDSLSEAIEELRPDPADSESH